AVNLRPFDQMDVCGAYDLRSDYSEVAVRVRPFSNRFFVAARYIRDNTEDLKLHSGYMASRTYLRSGNYLSEERAIYSLDVGYYLPVLAADLIVAGRAGYSDGDGIIFRNDDNEETGRYESNDGFFGGMSITTDF
ncbi:MAG: hypothetical protein GY771_03415, partial [bacterium]|nr:hypothetical protein [bacterium]